MKDPNLLPAYKPFFNAHFSQFLSVLIERDKGLRERGFVGLSSLNILLFYFPYVLLSFFNYIFSFPITIYKNIENKFQKGWDKHQFDSYF